MTKYHINGEGNPGLCKAQNGKCPFGGEANHYSSQENARKAFELSMASKANPLRKKQTSAEAIASAEGRRKLKEFARIFTLVNLGKEPTKDEVTALKPTQEKLRNLADSKASVGNMFERARKIEKLYKQETGADATLMSSDELMPDHYLQTVAPATAHVNFAMTQVFENDDWDVRTYGDNFESNARLFSELVTIDTRKKDAYPKAIATIRKAGWFVDDVDEPYTKDTVMSAIADGKSIAKTYGAQYKYEQTHLL